MASDKELAEENAELRAKLAEAIDASARNARKAEDAARQSSLLSAALEMVPVGVVIAEAPSGEILLGNSRVEAMLGHPMLKSEDVDSYGEWISYHADGRRVESREYPLARIIGGGEERADLDVHYQRGDGSRFWMKIVGRPIKNDTGEMVAAAVALIDIDKEWQLQREQEILIAELDHRVKNAFTVVKSIVSQSLRKDGVMPGLRETVDRRLDAYAKAHAGLVGKTWKTATMASIVRDIVGQQIAEGAVRADGPDITVSSKHALALSMAFYELSTNAFKYGALSAVGGTVDISWSRSDAPEAMLSITWMERGGPPAVTPQSKGFGTFITTRAVAMETGGSVAIDYPAEGLIWTLEAPYTELDAEEHND